MIQFNVQFKTASTPTFTYFQLNVIAQTNWTANVTADVYDDNPYICGFFNNGGGIVANSTNVSYQASAILVNKFPDSCATLGCNIGCNVSTFNIRGPFRATRIA